MGLVGLDVLDDAVSVSGVVRGRQAGGFVAGGDREVRGDVRCVFPDRDLHARAFVAQRVHVVGIGDCDRVGEVVDALRLVEEHSRDLGPSGDRLDLLACEAGVEDRR